MKWTLVKYTQVGRAGLAALGDASRNARDSAPYQASVEVLWLRWKEAAIVTGAGEETSILSGKRS